MTRQLGGGYQDLSIAALEERIRLLEYRVAILTEAVHTLRARLPGGHESADADAQTCDGIR